MRGVNLGSWLLLEAWMGPGDIGEMNGGFIDQWIWDEKAKTDQAFADRRTKHWAEWITDADIDEIAAVGLNTVRIPIGYWTFLSQAELDAVQVPFSPDGLPYLQKIIQKCASVGVAVLLDFHGLPSSQNGADHSGQGLHKDGQTDPAPFFFNDAAKASAVKAIANAAAMFAAPEYGGIVTTIQLANEPNPRNGASTQGKAENEGFDFLKGFFEEAYAAIRAVDTKVNVMFADGWADVTGDYWKSWGTDMQNVSMDTHYYTLYTPESQGMSGDDRIKWFCDRRDTLANAHMPTVVGEFSLQVPKEQPDGNGGDPANPQVQGFMRKSWVAQSATWEQGAGWTYWTWKHRDDNAWSFQQMLKVGVIPTPVTQYAVPNPCGWAQGQGQGQPPQQ
jgi:glucan 1,3-beta-glucosidase